VSSSATPNHLNARPLAAIILAAGKGKRMNSDLPKVVHPVAGRPMVCWVVDAVRQAGADQVIVVVGHGSDAVQQALADQREVTFVTQAQQLGTGHAVDQTRSHFASQRDIDVFVLAGDGPLIRPQTLNKMVTLHRSSNAAATLATSVIPDPTGYGRIIRDSSGGGFKQIVEHKDATPAQREIREVNPSYYCFQGGPLFDALTRIENNNASGEYYLTDVLPLMLSKGLRVEVIDAVPPEDVLSINDPQQLAEVDGILRARLSSMKSSTSASTKSKHTAEAAR
jgi:bifunctional UDP-N-acetylglucosamine pyrophosphorylase/glucosamine-1-phosphate N-acetyltransferase